ncbi:ribonuclease Y [Candidatus Campbellbacteria bacterium CG22_combo_CG10-13_8_21_14_all_36_13]|uniref:Ribonuclease Y n=1 Tax=Candidatus Campbellbacteria bacterium CG22_combo_CG10-13_8_21_14_all_36_13 TaxID=1974529 RepID=A0A2H0DYW8_9BACT|nr:MAG: ribonuclease Y [Candidatus Campbellbacteria bacterium CG22_combo_CG10-13_8_21_14_all_36_13]
MPLQAILFLTILSGLVGIALGYFLRWLLTLGKRGTLELEIKRKLLDAQEEANKITTDAEKKAEKLLEESRREAKEKEDQFKKTEDRLIKKESFLDTRQIDIDKEVENIKQKAIEIKEIREATIKKNEEKQKELERIAGMNMEEAKENLIKIAEKNYEEDILIRLQKIEQTGKEKLEKKAKDILVSAIHRYGNAVSSDVMATSVNIPSDDIKGKIIGKEGRNIKAFERASGVEVIIDDTPGTILISSYDPVRRQVARLALENLILDGRIQPARIEEFVEKAKKEINDIIKEKGEQAVFEVGVYNLDPRIISILGRLYFRTSYGQNVLQHSVEMAHIAGMLAEELGADVSVAKAGALLHDIGKAVDHEIPGTHVEIGMRILQKFGADQRIIDAMKSHHEEYPYETVESIIVQVADSISGSRPGARRDTIENYLKRLSELEGIANRVKGVEKSYAIQAGREVRVFVNPEEVNDIEARNIARNIALEIEKELKYPGEIKVNVIRESRVIEYAR